MAHAGHDPKPASARSGSPLRGRLRAPGDKSISHRSMIFGLLSIGETVIEGLLEGDDVIRTAKACEQLGATLIHDGPGKWRVHGVGIGGLKEPKDVLDFGNAGTGSRLMMGVAGSHPITSTFDGDASLRSRPMRRILDPLEKMGINVVSQTEGGRVPLTIKGPRETIPVTYETPAPSAQIKSAVLLAGLNSPGETVVIEQEATRDHTERMMKLFGADITSVPHGQFGRKITLKGQPTLQGRKVIVPSDPSSAAFPLVAALIVPGSEVVLEAVMMNPLRIGLIDTLLEMGADIEQMNIREEGGETVADLKVKHSSLQGVSVPAERAPSMIDEYPILAIAASYAQGTTRMNGLHELRVKECDRLDAVAAGLEMAGVSFEIEGDDLIVHGTGSVRGGGPVQTHLDHRIAMSFLIMGLASETPMTVDDSTMIATSFPTFVPMMKSLGAAIGD
ncbi:3-phosphoshikimate 1-carboxyvinyltransferase [Microvirga sp. W0021]|uniref:3-phosphoshikimate 1-carboxyvinyltransferase n=1 Tax=Hohaiivirga grylli TaxID=3133970 RepID=A0ABV0BG65_9HYPH